MTRQVSVSPIKGEEKPFGEAKRVRVVALYLADLCTAFSAPLPEKLKAGQKLPECLEFNKKDWVPVEFARSPYFRINERYSPRRSIFVRNIPHYLLRQYPENGEAALFFRPYESFAEFKETKMTNAIIVRIGETDRRANWSTYLSVLTLTIIPGYYEEAEMNDFRTVDEKGDMHSIDGFSSSLRVWLGLVFCVWGPALASTEEDVLAESLRSLLAGHGE